LSSRQTDPPIRVFSATNLVATSPAASPVASLANRTSVAASFNTTSKQLRAAAGGSIVEIIGNARLSKNREGPPKSFSDDLGIHSTDATQKLVRNTQVALQNRAFSPSSLFAVIGYRKSEVPTLPATPEKGLVPASSLATMLHRQVKVAGHPWPPNPWDRNGFLKSQRFIPFAKGVKQKAAAKGLVEPSINPCPGLKQPPTLSHPSFLRATLPPQKT